MLEKGVCKMCEKRFVFKRLSSNTKRVFCSRECYIMMASGKKQKRGNFAGNTYQPHYRIQHKYECTFRPVDSLEQMRTNTEIQRYLKKGGSVKKVITHDVQDTSRFYEDLSAYEPLGNLL